MSDRVANLLGVVGLAVANRIELAAKDVLKHSGETPAALVVIGYGLGPSTEELRRVLDLSHSGTVRLIDRLVAEGLVERRGASDGRAVALFLSRRGKAVREKILKGRLEAIRPFLDVLSEEERDKLGALLGKLLASLDTTDGERQTLCRLCDNRVCTDCPIPANFRDRAN
ncbi:MAG: MarR family transcriptional regulator [Pseudomonadota bacterium]